MTTWPKQAPVSQERIIQAPFNFVPLPESPLIVYADEQDIPGHDIYNPDLLSGHIDLEITTETLLYTRCASSPVHENQKVHQCEERQQFFHHGDPESPVVPGSSIRGMIRSLVEIIGYGKMTDEQMSDEYLVYRDVAGNTSLSDAYREQLRDESINAGFLHWQGNKRWIQPAEEHCGLTFGKVDKRAFDASVDKCAFDASEDGMNVWVIPNQKISSLVATDPGHHTSYKPGVLFKSGEFNRKSVYNVVFQEDPDDSNKINIPDDIWKIWQEEARSQVKRKSRKINNGRPVFYYIDSSRISQSNPHGLVFWGPTRYFRLPYPHSTMNFVPVQHKSKDGVDLATAVFGSTGQAGRVRFTDAKLTSCDDHESPFVNNDKNGRIVLKTLSSPRPTSFQEYLVQPISADRDPVTDPSKLLLFYKHPYPDKCNITGDIATNGTLIRGYKQYWNKLTTIESVSDDWSEIQRDTTQNTVIRPVQPGCHFVSRLYFENLTSIELGALLMALRLKDENSRHRLGMGKPYGMGRVKITSTLNIDDRRQRYTAFFAGVSSLSDSAEKEDSAVNDFSDNILEHHNAIYGSRMTSLWDLPRLRNLAVMLDKTERTGCNYPDFETEMDKFKYRYVLPAPVQVVGSVEQLDRQVLLLASGGSAEESRQENGTAPASFVIENGAVLPFRAKSKGRKWRFVVKDGTGEGALQPGSPLPDNIQAGEEYLLTVVDSGNKKNKGMILSMVTPDDS